MASDRSCRFSVSLALEERLERRGLLCLPYRVFSNPSWYCFVSSPQRSTPIKSSSSGGGLSSLQMLPNSEGSDATTKIFRVNFLPSARKLLKAVSRLNL